STLDPKDHTLDLLNVRYVFAPPVRFGPDASTPNPSIAQTQTADAALSDRSRWREIPERSEATLYSDFRIFENLRALPRAWLIDRVAIAYDGDHLKMIRGELPGRSFDPRVEALVDHSTAEALNPRLLRDADEFGQVRREESKAQKVEIIERRPTRIVIEAAPQKPAILVLSEIAYPGWRVITDGVESQLLRVNYDLRGVELKEGGHRIELIYSPPSIKIGAVVSITTALCLLLLVLSEKRKIKKAELVRAADVV
ncbi:MAG: YfhO family protein, partial [Acidobacteria bacterium]|nr:YfhO family protein [Acidobacteriota bacterium]